MNKDISLYLGGQKVDWSKTPDILLNYQRTDYQNPTITKNMWSKTLTIEGTPNNNNIFNHIWNLERVMDDSFILFNPSQKVQFELFNDAEIVETGYAKLDAINKDGYKIEYNITLYGGLGSFFYSLAYDINSDKEKTLADLNFMGGSNPDDEFDFEINKSAINDAWAALRTTGSNTGSWKKWDYINFAPSYNGLADGFDSDKVLINVKDASGMIVRYTDDDGLHYGTLPTTVNNSGTAYTPYNGYLYAEMQRDCNEWEMRDLRSYLQRPVLSVKGLFDAIKNPVNNGGYNVVLDQEFFSSGNPYYDKAWITLPLIDSTQITEDSYESWQWAKRNTSADYRPRFRFIELRNVGSMGDTPDILSINFEIHATFTGSTADTLYMITMFHSSGMGTDGAPVGDWMAANLTAFQFYINRNGNLGTPYVDDIASSNRLILASHLPDGTYWNGFVGFGDMPLENHTNQWCYGYWKRVSGSDYVWTMDDGTTLFHVDLETNHINTIPLLAVLTKTIYNLDDTAFNYDDIHDGYSYDAQYYSSRAEMNAHRGKYLFSEYPKDMGSEIVYRGGNTVRSYQQIKKKNLLGGMEGTPCDWLLSYCKLFGLFFEKDKLSDTIYIKMRKNWYINEQIDLDELIDRGQDINITPLTFESKWYNFNYTESEGKLLDKYKEIYAQDFGKQLIDTKYNFDADEIDLLEDNNYKNGLVALEKSNYFNLKYDVKGNEIFPCLYNWCTVSYFHEGEKYDIYMALPAGTNTVELNPNTPKEFYDFLPKLQLHDEDNGPVDGDGILVFFNGLKNTGDVDYWISDDIDEMFDNGTNPCWLQTRSFSSLNGNTIAVEIHTLPEFNRYCLYHNIITATWDFGYTKELYVPYYYYDVNRTPTMYENFWKAYIQDLYSVNTRNVDCYVALNANDVYGFMKRFYWWDNSLWVCTKVTDFDICVDKATKCSFTKVNDINAYFETPTFDDRFFNFYLINTRNVPAQGTDEERSFYFNLDCSNDWTVTDDGSGFASFDTNYPTTGTFGVGYIIKAKYLPNTSQAPRYALYTAYNNDGEARMIRVWQDGYVKEKYLTVTPNYVMLPKEVYTPVEIDVDSSADWSTSSGSWAILDTTTGQSGTTRITVSAATNNTGSMRSTQIVFSNTDGEQKTLTVKQKATEAVTLEQNEAGSSIYTVPASGGNVHYKLVNDVQCQVIPEGNTANFAIASGLVQYNTNIAPSNGTNFWIHFNPNTGTVTRNASFYAYYVDANNGRHSVYPTVVQLPLTQLASGNTEETKTSKPDDYTVSLGASMKWTATTNVNWITLLTTSGTASDTSITYSLAQNTGGYRTGYIYVTYTDEMGYNCNETIVIHQEGVGGTPWIVNPTAITTSDRGGDYLIGVTASTPFTVSVPNDWADNTSRNDNRFTIHIDPNEGYDRTMNIVVSANGETKTVVINQGSRYPDGYTLDYAPENIVFDTTGGTVDVTIRSDSDWTITDNNNE